MKGKLIKSDIQYRLHNEEGIVIATSTDGKLSIKNCEAIENGYDLDMLACDEIGIDISVIEIIDNKLKSDSSPMVPIHEAGAVGSALYHRVKGFEIGFQKALEILGDKKFSEEDMRKGFESGYETYNEHYDKLINSLQQTEFDVEILMESKDIDELRVDKGSFLKPNDIYKPKLDSDGCLILKRL